MELSMILPQTTISVKKLTSCTQKQRFLKFLRCFGEILKIYIIEQKIKFPETIKKPNKR